MKLILEATDPKVALELAENYVRNYADGLKAGKHGAASSVVYQAGVGSGPAWSVWKSKTGTIIVKEHGL